jgi:hypothetical protein
VKFNSSGGCVAGMLSPASSLQVNLPSSPFMKSSIVLNIFVSQLREESYGA